MAPTSSRWISAARSRLALFGAAAATLLAAEAAPAQTFGRPADTVRYPYVAALSRTTGQRRVYFCAGTLIAPRWILTAAHCFRTPDDRPVPVEGLSAEVGASGLADVPAGAQVRIARIVPHPHYDAASQADDIALIELAEEAGPLIAPLATAAPAADPAEATVVGFGSLYEGPLATNARLRSGALASQVSRQLRQAMVRIIAPAACAARLGIGGAATGAYQICAGAGAEESCVGDSGAPLIVAGADGADRVAGVVSFGSGCAVDLPVTVYTRVSAYAGWIAATMAAR